MEEVISGPSQSHGAEDPHPAEQSYQRNSHTVKEVLGPTKDFPIWGSGKGTEIPREFEFGGQWDWITELPQDWGNRPLEGANKTRLHQDPGEKRSVSRRDCAGLACECPGVSSGGLDQRASGQTTGTEHSPTHQQKTGLNIY